MSHSRSDKRRGGVSLVEIMMVVAIISVVFSMAVPSLGRMRDDQWVKGSIRAVADAFQLAQAEAIRTGNSHIVVFQGANGSAPPSALSTVDPVAIINDGLPSTADCAIAGMADVLHTVPAQTGIRWGTTPSLADANPVPGDSGFARTNVAAGSSFSDASVTSQTSASAKFASWVVFLPDGLPRLMTPTACTSLGQPGQGGGAIYLTNGRRDYAAVLSPLGAVRVHAWNPATGAWSQ